MTPRYQIHSDDLIDVEPVPGGPLLVRRATAVTDEDGAVHRIERPVVGLCVCGYSQRTPWCDGTHKIAAAPST